jgi:3-oxoacyl-[acyl-carrier protein] reductase
VLAKELAPRRIRVNAIAPGATDTEGARAQDLIGGDMVERLVTSTPLGRLGTPEDIGPVAAFLASEGARWVTGDVLFASGGSR